MAFRYPGFKGLRLTSLSFSRSKDSGWLDYSYRVERTDRFDSLPRLDYNYYEIKDIQYSRARIFRNEHEFKKMYDVPKWRDGAQTQRPYWRWLRDETRHEPFLVSRNIDIFPLHKRISLICIYNLDFSPLDYENGTLYHILTKYTFGYSDCRFWFSSLPR